MKLELLMRLRAIIDDGTEVGEGPLGRRVIFNVTGGEFEGSALKGQVLPSGADWILFDSRGGGRLDVRLALQTEDGACIYVQYFGVLMMDEKTLAALEEKGTTEYGDTYFMTQPRFETGDERYEWLNRVVAVAEGHLISGDVEYKIYHVTN